MSDKEKGLYKKFNVERTDGKSAPGEKHENCEWTETIENVTTDISKGDNDG